jgi:hypothetical protein
MAKLTTIPEIYGFEALYNKPSTELSTENVDNRRYQLDE